MLLRRLRLNASIYLSAVPEAVLKAECADIAATRLGLPVVAADVVAQDFFGFSVQGGWPVKVDVVQHCKVSLRAEVGASDVRRCLTTDILLAIPSFHKTMPS
jgi:hypothetical protein